MNEGKLDSRVSRSSKLSLVFRSLLTAGAGLALSGTVAGQESGERVEELIINATRLPRTIENIAGPSP